MSMYWVVEVEAVVVGTYLYILTTVVLTIHKLRRSIREDRCHLHNIQPLCLRVEPPLQLRYMHLTDIHGRYTYQP